MKKFGARMWIGRIMISWGIISALTMFVPNESIFYSCRFLLGIAEAGFFPGIIFYLTLWYPSHMRARKTALFMTAIALAGVIGNPLSGWIMDSLSGVGGLAGWKWVFLAEGLPSIIVGFVVMFYLNSSIQEAKWLTDDEKKMLLAKLDQEEKNKQYVRIIDAFKSGKVWLMSFVYFSLVIGLYGLAFWLPTIVKAFGLKGYLSVGLISATPYGIAVIGMIILSRSSDKTGERRWHTALTALAGGIGYILAGIYAGNPVLSIIFLSLGTLGVLGAYPLFWTIPSSFMTGVAAATGIGLINSFGNLGGYIGPNISVWVKPFWANPSAALYIIAGFMFASALCVLIFIPSNFTIVNRSTNTLSK
jgi:MFS family permease